jgi:GT2 family glycosyltransferase
MTAPDANSAPTAHAATTGAAPRATVVITTKNRKDELRKAVASCFTQTANPEVLVVDDGSTDGTSEMIRAEFPQVTLIRAEQSQGYIAQRNLGAQRAKAPIVFSIDDDAVFRHPRTIEQTLAEFDHERVGAVAIPYIDTLYGPEVKQLAPDVAQRYVTRMFRGTAHAVRRDLFLKLGAYEPRLIHQGEELDYCTRLFAAGYFVRVGRADPIDHNESPRRDLTRMMFHNARNHLVYAWQNIPFPHVLLRVLGMFVNLTRFGIQKKYVRATLRGLWAGTVVSLFGGLPRRPMPTRAYNAYRQLQNAEIMPWDDALKLMPQQP